MVLEFGLLGLFKDKRELAVFEQKPEFPNQLIGEEFILEFGQIATPINPDEQTVRVDTGLNFFPDHFEGAATVSFWTETGAITVEDSYCKITVGTISAIVGGVADDPANGKMIIEARVKIETTGANIDLIMGFHVGVIVDATDTMAAWWKDDNEAQNVLIPKTRNQAGGTTEGADYTVTDGEWHILKVEVTNTAANFYLDNILQETIAATLPDEPIFPTFWISAEGDTGNIWVDWVRTEMRA